MGLGDTRHPKGLGTPEKKGIPWESDTNNLTKQWDTRGGGTRASLGFPTGQEPPMSP